MDLWSCYQGYWSRARLCSSSRCRLLGLFIICQDLEGLKRDAYLLALDGFGGHTRPSLNYFKLRALRKNERMKKHLKRDALYIYISFWHVDNLYKSAKANKGGLFCFYNDWTFYCHLCNLQKTFRISRCSWFFQIAFDSQQHLNHFPFYNNFLN